jgi:pyruvoyl-dependent arginine decarboxylase (PvlArgDC)
MSTPNKKFLTGMQFLVLMPLLVLMTACSTTYQTFRAKQSGFLGDYSQLRKGHGEEAMWVYLNTNANVLAYTKIMIDPVALYLTKGSPLHSLPKEDLQTIANYFAASLREQLGKDFPLVDKPGLGVLRFRMALTDMRKSKVVLDTMSSVVPIGMAISGLERLALGKTLTVGSARMELEVLDAQTGVRLAAMVDERAGAKFTGKFDKWNRWQDVRDACDYWAERVRERLVELRARKQNKMQNEECRTKNQ